MVNCKTISNDFITTIIKVIRLLAAQACHLVAAAVIAALLAGVSRADAEAACHDTDQRGQITRTWVARYDVTPSIYGDLVRINFLGFRDPGSTTAIEFQSSNWRLIWILLEERDAGTFLATNRGQKVGSSQEIYETPVPTYFSPRIVTPDNRCTIYTRPFPYGDPAHRKLAILGDSLTYGFSRSWEQRQGLANYFANFGWRYDVDAFPGRTLYASDESEQARDRDMRDEIRGMVAANPEAVVINLGTNDAIIGAGAMLRGDPALRDEIRRRTVKDLIGAVSDIGQNSRCIILVTPSDYPTPLFGLGQAYENEAKFVGALMRIYAGWWNDDKVTLIDWAHIARSHHGVADNWFTDDHLHLNTAGSLQMIDLIGQAVRSCQ
jgi:lysophospholipase L1-like esterase